MGICASRKAPAVAIDDAEAAVAIDDAEAADPCAGAMVTRQQHAAKIVLATKLGKDDDATHTCTSLSSVSTAPVDDEPDAELSVQELQQLKAESAFELRDEGGFVQNGCEHFADDSVVNVSDPPRTLRAATHAAKPAVWYDPSIAGEAAWACLPAATGMAYTQKAYLLEGSWRRPFTRGDEKAFLFTHDAGRPVWDVLPADAIEHDRLLPAQEAVIAQRSARPPLTEEQREARLRRIIARGRDDENSFTGFDGIAVFEGAPLSSQAAVKLRHRREAAAAQWQALRQKDDKRRMRYWRDRDEWVEMELLQREQRGLVTFSSGNVSTTLQLQTLILFTVDFCSPLLLNEVVLNRDLRPAIEKI